MTKLAALLRMVFGVFLICGLASPCCAGYKLDINDYTKAEIGFWAQAWYQWVEDGKADENLNDFMLRRGYLSLKGNVTEHHCCPVNGL
jgi:hypothetical protein